MGQYLYGDAGDRFGWDVDVSDDGLTIAVSARHGENRSNALEEGYVRTYTYNASLLESGHWIQKGNNITGVYAKGEFGRSVALTSNGERIAVGAHEAGSLGEGQITVYDFVDNEWTQVGKPLSGEAFEDWQGTSLAINANGTILVTSADGNDRAGNESGLVRAYRLVDGTWSQYGQDILGECCYGFLGSRHIAISSDGNTFAVGARHLDNDRGKAYAYQFNGTKWIKALEVE